MERLLRWVFFGALALLAASCWQRDSLPVQIPTLPTLEQAPMQTSVNEDAFGVALNGVDYRIEPLFDYELYGLVVSFQHHNPERMLHERWNDHLNVADLCVVWGRNAQTLDLSVFEFWNGQFTCYFRTQDQSAWQQFDPHGISNNHLLTADDYLRSQIDRVQVGDQIRLRGQLANYSHGGGFSRGTSTVRTDDGNGACETVYVRDFQILASMSDPWRGLHDVGWIALIMSGGLWLYLVTTGRLAHRADD
jgi:hypothetical protein